MNQTNACIELKNVSKAYGDHRHAAEVVRNCSLDIEHGKVTVLIGPSGCGKSTLIRLIAGFEKPTSGSVLHNGKAVTRPDKNRLVLFQETALFPWMSTDENVMYGPQARGEATTEARRTATALIQRVGLQSFRDKFPGQLSGGMQRRAELARALVNNPQLMILDEPFRGLDAMTKSLMQEYFAELIQETRLTVLFVTTDVDEAIFLADRLVVMANIPTSVRRIMDVEIPRPRRLTDLVENDDANQLKMHVLSLLHEEAMRSFGSGGKASADFVDAYARRIGRLPDVLSTPPPH